jgi:hypothetical protein
MTLICNWKNNASISLSSGDVSSSGEYPAGSGPEALLASFNPGTLCKKLGIWHLAENLQNNLRFQKLRFYTPDHSRFFPSKNYWQKSGEIGSRFFPRIPDRQLTFPIIPNFSRISRALKLDHVW